MICRLSREETQEMLFRQLSAFYLVSEDEKQLILQQWDRALDRLAYSFQFNPNKYYSREVNGVKETFFDALHTCQWLMFLYRLGHGIFTESSAEPALKRLICDKLYGLSKTLSGADLYYEINLPDIFTCDHPVGAVLGRAVYGNYFSFLQGCSVGNNRGIFPVFGEHVAMKSGSKILGKCRVGDYVVISANAYIKDQDVPSGCLVFGTSPHLVFKPNPLAPEEIRYREEG